MPNFRITKNTNIPASKIEINDLYNNIQDNLSTYYNKHNISLENNGIVIKGNLKATLERAITKVNINIVEKNGFYTIKAQGSSSVGFWTWIWLLLSFTGFFFAWFLFDVITFLLAKDRPKEYITEAINTALEEFSFSNENSIKAEKEKNDLSENHNQESNDSYIAKLEKLAELKEKGVLDEKEFQLEKNKIMNSAN